MYVNETVEDIKTDMESLKSFRQWYVTASRSLASIISCSCTSGLDFLREIV